MKERIEVLYIKSNKKENLMGFIEGNKFLSKRGKIKGYVEDNKCYSYWDTCLIVDGEEIIEGRHGKKVGYIQDFKIYNSNDYLLFDLNKKKGEVYGYWGQNRVKRIAFKLIGNLDNLTEMSYIGFLLAFDDLLVW